MGESVIELDGVEYLPSAAHLFALLLRLGTEPDRLLQREDLIRWLYPDVGKRSAAHSARQLIYLAATRGAAINKTQGALSLASESLTCDLEEMLATDQATVSAVVRSVAVLPAYAPEFSAEFSEWLEAFRGQAHARIRHALTAALNPLRQRADWRRLEARARELLSIDPLSESGTLALAEALARTGSKERAVALLDAYRAEVETKDPAIAVPAAVLRKRIERDTRFIMPASVQARFVGREDTLQLLQYQLTLSRAGSVQVSVVAGEVGIGKTRLLEEFLALLTYEGGYGLVEVHGHVEDPFAPFVFFGSLVPKLRALRGAAGADPALLPFLDRLVGVPSSLPDPPATAIDTQMIAMGVRRALFDLVSAVCAERPLVIFVHDSRAVDTASIELLAGVLSSGSRLPVHLAIVSHSLDDAARFRILKGQLLDLRALTKEESMALLRSVDGHSSLPPATLEWCCDVGAGNPAHLHLLIAECLNGGNRVAVPANVLAAIDASLARLAPASLRVLEACIVLKDECDTATLSAVVGLPNLQLLQALNDLEHSGHIVFDGSCIHVRSTVTSDRLRARASLSTLGMLHQLAAVALATREPKQPHLWSIASHWQAAGQVAQARQAWRDAWKWAISFGEAQRAEASIRAMLTDVQDTRQRVDLFEDLISTMRLSGNHAGISAAINERALLIKALGIVDQRSDAMAFARLDAILPRQDDPFHHVPELLRLTHSRSLDDERRARAAGLLIVAADSNADPRLAAAAYAEIDSMTAVDAVAAVHVHSARLIFHTVFGDLQTASALARSAISLRAQSLFEWPHFRLRSDACLALSITGDVDLALASLEETYTGVTDRGFDRASYLAAGSLASLCFDHGELARARQWLGVAKIHAASDPMTIQQTELLSVEVDLALVDGRIADAKSGIARMRSSLHLYNAPKYQMDLVAYSLRVASFAGDALEHASIDALKAWYERARALGRNDDCVEALWAGLMATGRAQEATSLLRDYLFKYRRERRPARYMLRMRTARDPVWNECV